MTPLLTEEEAAVSKAVERRRREFATGRACARIALEALEPGCHGRRAIPVGPAGEPRWPAGIVGSITHCHGYRACAVAHQSDVLALGIDAEPNEPISERVLAAVACEDERAMVHGIAAERPNVSWDRLLFSAKESVYKTWYSLTGCRMGFGGATIGIEPDAQSFAVRLLIPGGPVLGQAEPPVLAGRWALDRGIVVTGVSILPTT